VIMISVPVMWAAMLVMTGGPSVWRGPLPLTGTTLQA
jgi:hypothetical protein